MTIHLDDDTLYRMRWGEKFIRWILPRLAGTDAEKELTLKVIHAAMSESHVAGTEDAAKIVEGVLASRKTRELEIVAEALRELARRNRRDAALPPKVNK
jgi:hypothetical protein